MRYGVKLVTAPTAEPLTLEEVRAHLRIDLADDDPDLNALVKRARLYVEEMTNRQLVTATWDLYLDKFPSGNDPLLIPKAPLQSVSSITYTDTAGTSQTWSASDYIVSTSREPGFVVPAFGKSYPVARDIPDSVKVRFVAGYGGASAVDERAKHAMLLLCGHWYEHREAVLTGTISKQIEFSVDSLLRQLSYGDEFAEYAA